MQKYKTQLHCTIKIQFGIFQRPINAIALWIVFCKSEAFQSVHHVTFILCYTVLYDFLDLRCRFGRHRAEVHRISCGLRFATVGAKRTSTGCPAPLYLPLSEFVNTGGTIYYKGNNKGKVICDKSSVFNGLRRI